MIPRAVAKRHESVDNMIWDQVHEFSNKYRINGHSREDLHALAHLTILERFPNFDPSRSKWSTWVHRTVEGKLKDLLRRQIRRAKPYSGGCTSPCEYMVDTVDGHEFADRVTSDFKLFEFIERLSPRAQYVVLLLLVRTPPELHDYLLGHAQGSSGSQVRIALARWLKDERGWTDRDVSQAFLEIRKVLLNT